LHRSEEKWFQVNIVFSINCKGEKDHWKEPVFNELTLFVLCPPARFIVNFIDLEQFKPRAINDVENCAHRALLPSFYESQDHVDQLAGGAVAPVVVLQWAEHLGRYLRPDKLLGVVKASLKSKETVVVLQWAEHLGHYLRPDKLFGVVKASLNSKETVVVLQWAEHLRRYLRPDKLLVWWKQALRVKRQ
jgi:hypothetical protein